MDDQWGIRSGVLDRLGLGEPILAVQVADHEVTIHRAEVETPNREWAAPDDTVETL